MPHASVVVVNYRSHDMIAANFDLLGRMGDGTDLVVVDSYSDSAERAAVEALCRSRGWVLVSSEQNLGFGAAANLGARVAFRRGAECILLANPDAVLTVDVAAELLRICRNAPSTVASPCLVDSAGSVVYRGAEVGLRTGRVRSTPTRHGADGPVPGPSAPGEPSAFWLTGACLAVHQELFIALGGFDERYFMYWEDVDFSYRAAQAGATLLVRLDLVAVHDEGGTQGRGPGQRAKSDLYYYYNARNRLLFAARHLQRHALMAWIGTTPKVTWEIYLQGGRRQLVRSPSGLLNALFGAAAGMAAALWAARRRAAPAPPAEYDRHRGTDDEVPLLVTIAVLTYRRPDDLSAALPLLLDQVAALPPGHARAEILVVDNDPAAGARPIVEAYRCHALRYVVEPRPGIPAARNRALDEADGSDLLVFIDDDERPHLNWLVHMLATRGATGAALVAGPVVSTFAGELDPWVTAGFFFRRRRLPTGTPIDVAATNNLLLDLRAIRALGVRFDPRFGMSGADDTLFTRTLSRHGARMVWCDEAVVTDVVPAKRTTRSWVLRRAFSSGNSWSITSVAMARTAPERWSAGAFDCLRGATRLVAGAARFGVGVAGRHPRHQARGLRTLARGAGMIVGSANLAYQEYGRTPGAASEGDPGEIPWLRRLHRVRRGG